MENTVKLQVGDKVKDGRGRTGVVSLVDDTAINETVVARMVGTNGGVMYELYYSTDGFYAHGGNSLLNISKVSEWDDFEIDDPVMVTNGGPEAARHFAGISSDGRPKAFHYGQTSFTTSLTSAYISCRKATPEELSK